MVFSLLVHLNLLAFAAACRYSSRNRGSSRNSSQTQERRTTGLGPPHQLWPKDSNSPFHTIPICYADYDSWKKLNRAIDVARKMWTNQLGNPGQANGHALRIVEPEFDDDNNWCYISVGVNVAPVWNTNFDPATVVIRTDNRDVVGAEATPGYKPGNRPGRHQLIVYRDEFNSRESHKALAHEFGHVFGLEHEHARNDRDRYVHFECRNLEGYNKALGAIRAEANRHTIEQVCEYQDLAVKYEFFAAEQFAKFKSSQSQRIGPIKGPFDINSIMIYDSLTMMERSKDASSFQNWPLVMWRNVNQNSIPTERTADNCDAITTSYHVTDVDRDGVKYFYPW